MKKKIVLQYGEQNINMNKDKFYILLDTNCFTFEKIVRVHYIDNKYWQNQGDEKQLRCEEDHDINLRMKSEYINNLFNREEISGGYRSNDGKHWQSWTISEREFNYAKKLIELYKVVEEFNLLKD